MRLKAFTLIELLTVIAVIAILTAILIPSLSGIRQRAEETTSYSNLRQIYAASMMYSNEHSGRIPPALYAVGGTRNTWLQFISPYVEGEESIAEGGTRGAAYIASDALTCPRWEDSPNYRPNESWKTGYGMNYYLMRPTDEDARNIKELNNSGQGSDQRDMFFHQIPFPETTILIGNSSEFHIGTIGVAETDRWDEESHVLYVDGRVASVTPEVFIRNWEDPSEK